MMETWNLEFMRTPGSDLMKGPGAVRQSYMVGNLSSTRVYRRSRRINGLD